jgi:Tryptophan-rich Synechocystis species C-terminal domain
MVRKVQRVTITDLIALPALVAMTACSSQDRAAPAGEKLTTSHAAIATHAPGLLWEEYFTGNFSAWILSGTTVTESQDLNTPAPRPADGGTTLPSDTIGNELLFLNQQQLGPQGVTFEEWTFDDNGAVTERPQWSTNCDSNCANGRFVGYYGGNFLWWEVESGAVEIGLRDGNTIFGTQTVSWQCGYSNGCIPAGWVIGPRADFDGDGTTDILWRNQNTGELSVWLLDSNANVIGAQAISPPCDVNCRDTSFLVNAATDLNADGHVDLTWWAANGGGQLSAWLLDGTGNVTGTSTFSSACDPRAGCDWHPVGYVYFP